MPTTGKADFLIGRIALREGLITRDQLYDGLISQERNPSKTLGQILITRGYLKTADVSRLLDLQKQAMVDAGRTPQAARGSLLGRILVEKGFVTEYQVNECLRLQGKLIDLGIAPLPQLGEILVKRKYIKREAVDVALHLQNLPLYSCPECGARLDVKTDENREDITCQQCKASIPFLFAKMAAAVHEAAARPSDAHDIAITDEVRKAATDPKAHFGKYILLQEIGRGGAGIVYRAWQKDLNKIVALKLLPHESDTAAGIKTPYGDAEDVKRFYNETRAAAEIDHPNIVPVLDFGAVDNHFFYTMPCIDGVTLDRIVREGMDERHFQTTYVAEVGTAAASTEGGPASFPQGKPMPVKLAVAVMRDVALAVHFAHQRGIFHRDIKPANIIIDRKGKPWVMDFGLAKVCHIGDSSYVKGVIMGTPYYMPPEQASGDMERVDAVSDIYSIGAVMYELLCGNPPYAGKSPDEVLAALGEEPPEPIERMAPSLPDDVKAVVRKTMARDKDNRYPRAILLAEDLQRVLEGQPLETKAAPGERPSKIWKAIKGLFGAGS